MTPPEFPRNFSAAAAQYLDWYRAEHGDRPSTWRRVEVSFVSLARWFGGLHISGVGAAEVESYKSSRRRQVKDVTIRHDLHALSGFFRFSITQGWCERNPVREVRVPSDRDAVRMRVLSADEERRYLAAAERHAVLHAVAHLMLATGVRPSEALGLRGSDYDASRRRIAVRGGKTAAARRSIRLLGTAASIIESLASARRGYLFPGGGGGPCPNLHTPHNRACRRAGVAFCLYDLRHTFASRAAAAGMPLTSLAAILGHAGLRCVMRYVHPLQEVMDEAMEKYGRRD